jgi:hypothetical protein
MGGGAAAWVAPLDPPLCATIRLRWKSLLPPDGALWTTTLLKRDKLMSVASSLICSRTAVGMLPP